MPVSLFAAAAKVADSAGFGTYAGAQVYRALQDADILPKSSGRRICFATPPLVASYIIGLCCGDEIRCFVPLATARHGSAHNGYRLLKNEIALRIDSPKAAAEVDHLEFRRDEASAVVVLVDGQRIEFAANPDYPPPAIVPSWLRHVSVVRGELLQEIACGTAFDRSGLPAGYNDDGEEAA